jgi:putative endonuclease
VTKNSPVKKAPSPKYPGLLKFSSPRPTLKLFQRAFVAQSAGAEEKQLIGQQGEAKAAAYLEDHHCQVLSRRARTHYGEVDLLVLDGDCLVAVEVKTRRSISCGFACEGLSSIQRHRQSNAVEYWRLKLNHRGPVRQDLIAIEEADGEFRLEHFRNV